jgi:hypothetical protein
MWIAPDVRMFVLFRSIQATNNGWTSAWSPIGRRPPIGVLRAFYGFE